LEEARVSRQNLARVNVKHGRRLTTRTGARTVGAVDDDRDAGLRQPEVNLDVVTPRPADDGDAAIPERVKELHLGGQSSASCDWVRHDHVVAEPGGLA
jgi:hypothetical protein